MLNVDCLVFSVYIQKYSALWVKPSKVSYHNYFPKYLKLELLTCVIPLLICNTRCKIVSCHI